MSRTSSILHGLLRLALCASLIGALLGTFSGPASSATGDWIQTDDRQAVIDSFNNEFGAPPVAADWTGSGPGCQAGRTSDEYRQDIFDRINYFRSMAGVPAIVSENAEASRKAQQAALMAGRTGRISHDPDASFVCLTSAAAAAAAESNLFLGLDGVNAINGYMNDDGNLTVGHRATVLHPPTRQMGTGDVPHTDVTVAANTLTVFDQYANDSKTPLRDGFVAWPPSGFVPSEIVAPTWSFSVDGADFRRSTVQMSTATGAVPLLVDHRGNVNGAPWSVLTWTPTDLPSHPTSDLTLSIRIDNVDIGGSATSFTYDVTIVAENATARFGDGFRPYIDRAHRDFLDRPATAAELDNWSIRLGNGLSRFEFVEHLSSSDAWTSNVVHRLYLDTLGRGADEDGRLYWIGVLQEGTPVATVAAAFYGSPEYVARQGGSAEPWVAGLYQVLLNRDVDDEAQDYWADQTRAVGSHDVAYRLYQSPESREIRVAELYHQFLGRSPDRGGQVYWADILASGDDLQLAAFLASSDEYFNRK